MTAATLNNVDLGNVENISYLLDKNLIPLALGVDSDGVTIYDLFPPTVALTISGVFTGSDTLGHDKWGVKAQVDALADEIDAVKQESANFYSDPTGTIIVRAASLDVMWNLLDNKATYSLRLLKGK